MTSKQLESVSIQLDVRQFKYKGPSQLMRMVQAFLYEQRSLQMDHFLSSFARFRKLQRVRVDLLCSTATHAPKQNLWQETINAKFPRLRARRLLV